METKTIKQTVELPGSPEEIYEILMDSKKHSDFTGDKAVISNKVGGKFSAFSGYMDGENLELIPGKKIVQTWKSNDAGEWPDQSYYSTITFKLEKDKEGTKLTFTHEGVPAESFKSFADGWEEYYWKPLKKYLKNKQS